MLFPSSMLRWLGKQIYEIMYFREESKDEEFLADNHEGDYDEYSADDKYKEIP